MKILKTILAAVLLFSAAPSLAQPTYDAADGTRYEFQRHFFVNAEIGGQYTLGEARFRDLLSPNAQLGLGLQFSPVLAVRLQANAWQSKGGWKNYRNADTSYPFDRDYAYNYVAPGLDVMLNLSNLLCGYNPTRLFNLSAFVGGGANIAFRNGEVNRIANHMRTMPGYDGLLLDYLWSGTKVRPFGRAGLEAAFRLSDIVSLTVEGNANILSDKYNSKKAGNADWYFNALAGLRFNLSKPHRKLVPEVLQGRGRYGANGQELTDTVYVTRTEVKRDTVYVEKPEQLRRDVFFLINKWDIRPSEQQKVQDVADYLRRYPASKVSLCGYADVQTGNNDINDRLGKNRVEAVKQALMTQYGIPESRIVTDSKGSRVQPFPVNEDNRVTICICE
jgi:outer membrane protein OmpA-like peptidoglycan-associated protein